MMVAKSLDSRGRVEALHCCSSLIKIDFHLLGVFKYFKLTSKGIISIKKKWEGVLVIYN